MPSFDEMLRELDAPKTKSFDEMLRELDAQSATPALSLRNATKADESPSFDDLMQMQTQVGTPEQEAANQAALAEGGENIKRFINDTYHAGMGGVETGMANMSDALAYGVRAVPLMGGVADWIGEGSNWWDARAREHAQKVGANNLWTSSVNALGSTAPSMATSLALAATGNLSQAGQMLMPKGLMSLPQKMLSAAMMYRSGEEAIGNAGRTYREAIQEGRPPEQAQSQANRQLAAELPMNVFFDKAGIFGDAWDGIQSPLKRGLAMTLSEVIGQGGQEVGQDVIGDAAAATRDRGIPEYLRAISENVTNAEYLKQKMKDTFLPTGLSSLIGAALGLGVRSMRNGRGGNVDNFARGVPDTGTQQAVAEIMQPVKEAWRREELNNWVPQSVGTVPGNVAPQTPEKMSDVFKPVEPQPVIPETAKPLPGAMPAAETPVPTGKKAEAVAAANMQKVAEIADVTPAVEQPAQKELIPEDTDETLDDLRAQMAEEYRNVRQMDAEERENLPPSTFSGLMEQSGRRYEQSPNVRDVIGRAPEQDMVISGEESTQQAGREGEFVQSMREVQERVTRQLKDAGADDETANAGGEVWANHLLARARALGMDEHGRLRSDALTSAELDKLEIEGERAAENASDTYGQTAADEIKRQGQLKRDRIAWSRAVDKFIAGEMGSHDFARVMDMPLALQLAGAPVREIVADHKFFGHTLRGKHSAQITPALMKKLVTSLADPIMVFDSDSHPGTSLVAMLELQDNFGATIVVPVRLQMNPGDPKSPAKITSFYGKGNADTRAPNNRWFVNQIKKGNLRYINTKKSTRWSSAGGLQLPKVLAPTGSFKNSIKTEADLVKLRKENGNRFYQEQEERAQIIEAAKANGTYLKTPYGTETNLTPEQWVLVRTKQFKEWFGDWENDPENASKVLDGNGEPLVVYHGSTHTGFSTFSTAGSMAYPGTGAFFSGRKDVAATYSGSDELISREPGTSEPALSGEGVYPVFLNLRNPYRIDAEGKDWTNVGEISVYDNETGESVYDRDGEPFRTPREAEEYIERDLDDYSGRYEVSYSAEMTTNEIAQSVGEGNYGDGFDGVIFENVIDEGRWGDVLSADNVYVAFAPNQIKAVDNRGAFSSADANIYNQRQNKLRRGQIQIGSHGEGLVTLFKHADRSTFFHEIGHMMLDDLISDGLLEKANARTKADLETVRKYLGIGDLNLSKRHTFDGAEKARYAEAQERFARSFEAYLMEGKSPTAEMQSVFAKIKQWLIDIYRDIKRLGVELSPEVREVFDRLLATPERGDFGPIFRGYEGEAAVEKLLKERQGEVVGAMSDPRLGENSSIDFVWGTEKYGLAHIEKKHGADALMRIPQIIRKGAPRPLINHRISYETDEGLVVLKNEWKGAEKNWILTSYLPQGTKKDSRSAQDTQTGGRTEESASSSDGNLFSPRISQNPNNSNRDFSVRGDLPQVTVTASPESKSAGTLIRVKDIYDKLRAIAPVRKGVSAPANVAGYYTPETDVARERHWGDFPTALHEIGHALDYKLGLRESVRDAETSRQLYDELCELGKATSPQNVNTIYERLHGRYMHASGAEARGPDVSAAALKFEGAQRYLMKEGIAEYFRGYAYSPDLMEIVAPEYTKLFRETLEAHEEYQQPVSELFDAVRSYSELTPEQKLRAGMIRGDEKVRNQKGTRAAVAEAWNGFRQKFDDQLRYLEQMQNLLRDRVRELAKKLGGRYADMLQHGELKDEFAVYDMLRTMPGYMGKAKRDVLALMEPVKKLGDEAYAKLTGYMKALRALDYWDNGLEPGIGLTRAEVSAVVNRTRHENPELARIAEDIAKAYEAMVERTLIDSGVWSRGQYEEYKKRWPHYVPFVRVNEDGSVTSPTRRGKGIVNLSNQVKQATGVGAEDAVIDIKDPFEMMVKNALVFNQLAEKNRAAQALVRAALADPALFADMIEPVQGGERGGDTFTVWFDGTRRAFTGDKKLIDALAAMEQAAGIRNPIFGSLDRAAQGAANLLKLGATRANPAFILTNFIRDAMYSSLTNSARGARSMPFFGTVKGLLMQTAKDDASKQRIADALDHGLAYSGITELGLNASEKGISKYVGKAVHGDKGFLRKLASAWDNTIGKYNEMVELAPKFAEYERLVKEGYPKRYAARMAREVNLDFSRGGQWGKVWNRYTAFFNPAVQGTSKLVRTAAAHPGRFAARTAMYVILPSLISWMAGRDDDEYKRISRNIKDRYWVFKVGGTWLRLPKPELAGMFGSAVERVLDAAFEHDPMAFRELGRSVWEGFSPNLLPTFAEPILEHRMGKTFFYDSPLIPPQLENLPPELQFTKNTSSMAKFLGKAWGVSPILIDHYVSSYGGGVGEYLSKVPDIFLKPQEEAKKLSEKPLFSRFTVDPNRNSESLAKFYDLRRQATVAKNAYDVRRKMGEQPEYSAGVHMAKAFDQAARKLSDWRKDIAAIQQSKSMTPERKREVIDRIRLRMNQEAEAAVGSYFTVKEKLDRRKR